MKATLTWFIALAASTASLFAIGGLISSGCYYEVCEPCACGDSGPDGGDGDGDGDVDSDIPEICQAPPEDVAIHGWIEGTSSTGSSFGREPENYVALVGSGQVTPQAILDPTWVRPPLPDECIEPIGYEWDFGNGQTASGETPAAVSYTTGNFTATMTSSIASGQEALSPALLHVSVWNGSEFRDNFERGQLDRMANGWMERITDVINRDDPSSEYTRPESDWVIVEEGGNSRLYSTEWPTDYAPGSNGVITIAEATNARVSVRQWRGDPQIGEPHYSDIILRYRFNERTPQGPSSSFYRTRIGEWEEGEGYVMCLDAYKIEGANEGGDGLNGSNINDCGNPMPGFTGDSFYITAEITGGAGGVQITVTIDPTENPATPWHTATFTDTESPHAHAGRFGVGQFMGETYFDDFVLTPLP